METLNKLPYFSEILVFYLFGILFEPTYYKIKALMHPNLNRIFDFILLKLIKLYVLKKGTATDNLDTIISEFNKKNNFDQSKVNLYPYLITMGNGHKVELLQFFGNEFFYTPLGIFHRSFYTISSSEETEHIKFSFSNNGLNIEVKPEFKESFEKVPGNTIENKLLGLLVIENHSDVLSYINKSIDSIDLNYPDHFIIGNHTDLLNLNRINTGFINLENSIKKLFLHSEKYSEKKKLEVDFNEKIKYERSRLEIS